MLLTGGIIPRSQLNTEDIQCMYALMDQFYSHMRFDVFVKDLDRKDHCLLLRNESGDIVGFSTQQILSVPVGGKQVCGVFSGDTIIHNAYWGSTELFRVFAQYYFEYAERYDEFYWFLISKGYKTYKILSTFFLTFYPNGHHKTPLYEKAIMDAYGACLFPGEYNPVSGVVEYQGIKDALRPGVADIDNRALRDPHVRFFAEANPGYAAGNDLVCLALMNRENTRRSTRRFLGISQ